ncbi:MAG: metal ABC transporter substrate-binding protein [Candidatus Levyibacteriota bacterium]
MKKLALFLLGLIVILFIVFAVRNNTMQQSSGKLQVAASFYPMYFFGSQIGGDKVSVFNITPASAEPHDYEPTTQDVARINNSKMLILNGGKLEAWGDKIKDQLKGTDVLIVTAGEGLADREINEDGQNIQDPHVWQNPILAKKEAAVVEKGFEKIDPKDETYFQANLQKLNTELDTLNSEYKNGLVSCKLKDFVTSHAAFGYMAQQYGINQVAISGVSPDEEPSSQKLADIANLVKKESIKVVFFESLVSPKLSDTIATETGAKALVLDPLEGIPQKAADTGANYFSIMRQNLSNLQEALQCSK